jgi:hypothetical protein
VLHRLHSELVDFMDKKKMTCRPHMSVRRREGRQEGLQLCLLGCAHDLGWGRPKRIGRGGSGKKRREEMGCCWSGREGKQRWAGPSGKNEGIHRSFLFFL